MNNNHTSHSRQPCIKRRITLVTATLATGLFVFWQPAFAHDAIPQPASINVSGTGKAAVAPDMAVIDLSVVRDAKTAREALTANSKAMSDVVNAMKAEGIAERDLQTSGFNIQPRYIYPRNRNNEEAKPPQLVGYQVMNNLTVRIRDLTRTGAILDKVVTLGVNSGGNVRFTTDDPSDALRQARKNAMAEAIDKAKTLVDAAGVALGKIISINEIPVSRARTISAVARHQCRPRWKAALFRFRPAKTNIASTSMSVGK